MSHLPRGQKDLEQQCHIIFNAMSASDHGYSVNTSMMWLIVHSTVCKNWRCNKLSLNCHSSTDTKSPRSLYLICMLRGQVQFSSVAQSCLTLCDPMDCSTPGLPVHHQLPEFTQIRVHWVDDVIQPSHPLPPPSPPAFNLSQHQGLFQWVTSLHQAAKDWSFSFSISPSNEYS